MKDKDSDFTKKQPRPSLTDKAAAVDLDLGKFRLPGQAPMDLVGIDPADLLKRREAFLQLRAELQRNLRSEWQCTQCKKVYPNGENIRVVIRGGSEVFVCPDQSCDAPVIRKDARPQ